ncbi:IclR family transcriptional regulator [Liquorilactobacillus vini]|uniref:IclR family transcriptional regulator n=1 Tax=Liquorilactobacillus vini DSM 20605 TaxID=1133569 RepID=A0A0R2CF30_9LACO|nr:IclR family transcriptional regulator [Liquorilactobacillus vini]KRM87033.1 hypothetical protein FD21_GL001415 [Liquorilactobacillus vini DSM 20605]
MLKTLDLALKVLNLFSENNLKWTAKEISDKLDLNQVKVYRILETFKENNYLLKDEITKQYEIGPAMSIFSSISFDKYNVYKLIKPYIEQLMKETGEAVYLVKREKSFAVNLDAIVPQNKVSFAISINQKAPLYAGASYWAILAYLPAEIITKILDEPFNLIRKDTSFSKQELIAKIKFLKENGWVSSYELITPDIAAIASPIFYEKKIVGSVTVGKPIYRTNKKEIPQLGKLVKTTADQISSVLSNKRIDLNHYEFFKKRNNFFS